MKGVNTSPKNAATTWIGRNGYPLWKNAPSLFVLSTGRTGTDTMRHLLSLSEYIDAFHEPRPQLLKERKQARTGVYTHSEHFERIFKEARGWSIFRSYARSRIYAETSARLTFFAPVIKHLLPRSKFIYLHRHPGDIVRSGMRRNWYVDHPADYARITPTDDEVDAATWARWSQFEKICWYWDAYNRFALRFLREIPDDRVLSIPSSSLFSGAAANSIFEFLGVAPPSAEAIAQISTVKHNAQTDSDFPKYDSWTPEMKEKLADIAGETMARLGYVYDESYAQI